MVILLHSSKTMHQLGDEYRSTQKPVLHAATKKLATYLQALDNDSIAKVMKVSPKLAEAVRELLADWTDNPAQQRCAIDSFAGDIYSGLHIEHWTAKDRQYAENHLRILSGLYGILKPNDGMYPYRLEMGYRLQDEPYNNLYKFWGERIAKTLPGRVPIVNLTAAEYSKTVTPYIDAERIITPNFLTISPKTGEPTFVVVHAKIARGAFASWLIRQRVTSLLTFKDFTELGYRYNVDLSQKNSPVFVCNNFAGLGLSVRLKHKAN